MEFVIFSFSFMEVFFANKVYQNLNFIFILIFLCLFYIVFLLRMEISKFSVLIASQIGSAKGA